MGLVYLPTFTIKIYYINVGTYTSPMDPMGNGWENASLFQNGYFGYPFVKFQFEVNFNEKSHKGPLFEGCFGARIPQMELQQIDGLQF